MVSSAVHAADVTWVGPAVGQWANGANWSGGTVPQPEDNVLISNAAVNVSDARVISGSFTLADNALLMVGGASAIFEATGATTFDNGRVTVMGGAMAVFPNLVDYVWDLCEQELIFQVVGMDSVLSLPALESIVLNAPGCADLQASIIVADGGVLELDALQSIEAIDGQRVALTWLGGGMITLPNLVSLDHTFLVVSDQTSVDLPSLTSITDCSVTVNAGGMLSANALPAASDTVFSIGSETSEFAVLTTMTSCLLTFSMAGDFDLPELVVLRNSNVLIGDGTSLSLPKLVTLEATDGLYSFSTVGTGAISAPLLNSVRNMNFVASLGSTLSLPSVRTFRWDLCEGGAIFTTGTEATIDFSGLENLTIQNSGCTGLGYPIGATGGSRIDLSGLRTLSAPTGQFVTFLSANPGTVIDVSSLVNFNALVVTFFENDSGVILRAGSGGEGEGEGEGETPGAGCPAPASARSTSGASLGDLALVALALCSMGAARRRGSRR